MSDNCSFPFQFVTLWPLRAILSHLLSSLREFKNILIFKKQNKLYGHFIIHNIFSSPKTLDQVFSEDPWKDLSYQDVLVQTLLSDF